jgi:hypothetical protein
MTAVVVAVVVVVVMVVEVIVENTMAIIANRVMALRN